DDIFTFLDDKDRLSMREVCKTTRQFIDETSSHPSRRPPVRIILNEPIGRAPPELLELSIRARCPIFLLPLMDSFTNYGSDDDFQRHRCATATKEELLQLLPLLQIVFECCSNCSLQLYPADREADCLEIIETLYGKLPIDELELEMIEDNCLFLEKIKRMQPNKLSLHMDGAKDVNNTLSVISDVVNELTLYSVYVTNY
ncbi:hypothetical protein PFISCL1PPCAC_3650, partial [Pristionchus fissidentatus]